jgi:hypothetical protein
MNSTEIEAFLNGPALSPPLGVAPDFSHPESISIYCIPITILGLSLTTLAVSARLYTRYFVIHNVGWEDCRLNKLPNLQMFLAIMSDFLQTLRS